MVSTLKGNVHKVLLLDFYEVELSLKGALWNFPIYLSFFFFFFFQALLSNQCG